MPFRYSFVVLGLFTAAGTPGRADEGNSGHAAAIFKGCMNCHQPPDLAFASDRVWVDHFKTTAWMAGKSDATRAAVVAYLKSGKLDAPRAISQAPGGDEPRRSSVGFVTPSFANGSLIVKNKTGDYFRLAWESASKSDDKRRALPPGEYQLVGYRMTRRDDQGVDWLVSCSGKMRKFTVQEGQTQELRVTDAVTIECKGMAVQQVVAVAATVQGAHAAGLSIFRDGKRIPLRYRITDAEGKELAAGELAYGWGGGAGASCKLEPEQLKSATVSLIFAKPPFELKGAQTAKVMNR